MDNYSTGKIYPIRFGIMGSVCQILTSLIQVVGYVNLKRMRQSQFKKNEAKLVVGIDHIAFKQKQTFERLKQALYVIASWDYTFTGWNCEHLGRLIATDRPRCYQSKPIWWLCNMTPEGDHQTARQIFQDYLSKVDPSLIR